MKSIRRDRPRRRWTHAPTNLPPFPSLAIEVPQFQHSNGARSSEAIARCDCIFPGYVAYAFGPLALRFPRGTLREARRGSNGREGAKTPGRCRPEVVARWGIQK